MRWFWSLILASVSLGASAPKRCPETPTVVRMVSEKASALKTRFESMSHLPYDIQVRELGPETELRIGYRCPSQKDQFSEPGSLGLLGKITRMLLPEAKTLGIKSIRLDFHGD